MNMALGRIGRIARSTLVGSAAWVGLMVAAPAEPARVDVLVIDGMINPATAEFFSRGLVQAQAHGASLVVLELDTPGGLDTSMRAMIKDILNSTVPVATWVGPAGARAASAGTYILYASHIAAMSPASNLGAATPIATGTQPPDPGGQSPAPGRSGGVSGPVDTLHEKAVNDAAA